MTCSNRHIRNAGLVTTTGGAVADGAERTTRGERERERERERGRRVRHWHKRYVWRYRVTQSQGRRSGGGARGGGGGAQSLTLPRLLMLESNLSLFCLSDPRLEPDMSTKRNRCIDQLRRHGCERAMGLRFLSPAISPFSSAPLWSTWTKAATGLLLYLRSLY